MMVRTVKAEELAKRSIKSFHSRSIYIFCITLWIATGFISWCIGELRAKPEEAGTNEDSPIHLSLTYSTLTVADMTTFYATVAILSTLIIAMQVSTKALEDRIAKELADQTEGETNTDSQDARNSRIETLDPIKELNGLQGTIRIFWIFIPIIAYWISAHQAADLRQGPEIAIVDPAAILVLILLWNYGVFLERTRTRASQLLLTKKEYEDSFLKARENPDTTYNLEYIYYLFSTTFVGRPKHLARILVLPISLGLVGICLASVSLFSMTSTNLPDGPLVFICACGTILTTSVFFSHSSFTIMRARLFSKYVFYMIKRDEVDFYCSNMPIEPPKGLHTTFHDNESEEEHRKTVRLIIPKRLGYLGFSLHQFVLIAGSLIGALSAIQSLQTLAIGPLWVTAWFIFFFFATYSLIFIIGHCMSLKQYLLHLAAT